LFRQKAMDKMLAPDELDRLMRVVDPKGWLALLALSALVVPVALWGVLGSIPTQVTASDGLLLHRDALHSVVSPISGIVTEVAVETGDTVKAGQVVVHVATATGAEADVDTLFTGTVVDVPIDEGMLLERGQQVAVVEEGDEPLEAVFFVPAEDGKQLDTGMQVHVSPATTKAEKYGYLEGTIASVSQLPVTEGDMLKLLQDQSLVDALRTGNDQL
jgi:multidrug efflux pump subunit AcrA (membrane-fusion protein)